MSWELEERVLEYALLNIVGQNTWRIVGMLYENARIEEFGKIP